MADASGMSGGTLWQCEAASPRSVRWCVLVSVTDGPGRLPVALPQDDTEPCIVRLEHVVLVVGCISGVHIVFGARAEVPDPVLVTQFGALRAALHFFYGTQALCPPPEGGPQEFGRLAVQIGTALCSLLLDGLHNANPLRALHPVLYWPMSAELQVLRGRRSLGRAWSVL